MLTWITGCEPSSGCGARFSLGTSTRHTLFCRCLVVGMTGVATKAAVTADGRMLFTMNFVGVAFAPTFSLLCESFVVALSILIGNLLWPEHTASSRSGAVKLTTTNVGSRGNQAETCDALWGGSAAREQITIIQNRLHRLGITPLHPSCARIRTTPDGANYGKKERTSP